MIKLKMEISVEDEELGHVSTNAGFMLTLMKNLGWNASKGEFFGDLGDKCVLRFDRPSDPHARIDLVRKERDDLLKDWSDMTSCAGTEFYRCPKCGRVAEKGYKCHRCDYECSEEELDEAMLS